MKRLFGFLLAALAAFAPSLSTADTFPNKPVRIIVGYPPGGGADTIARMVGKHLTTSLGQPVVIENKPGADGILAGAAVANAAPDGYTLLFVSSSHAINVALGKQMPYDTVRDFAPVVHIVDQQLVLVTNPTRPYKTLPELLNFLKANPGVVNFGSSSTGAALPAEFFGLETSTRFVHVPYKGTSPVISDLLAGHVDLTMAGAATAVQHVKAGKLRALGVGSTKRSSVLPDTPAINEFIPNFEAAFWSAVFVPAKTPKAIVDRLNTEIVKITRLPEFQSAMHVLGADVVGSTPEELGQFVSREIEKWSRVVKDTGFAEKKP